MAGKGYTRVNFVTMGQVEQDFDTTQKGLQSELDELQKQLEALLDPADPVKGFVGAAGEAYETNKRKWQKAAGDAHQALQGITALVGEINHNYQATEKATTDLWTAQ
jgi:WXG100 family type VII secretion target